MSYMYWIIENTDRYRLLGVSDILRSLLFTIANILKLLIDAVEQLYKLSYRMFDFLVSDAAISIISEYKVFIVTGLVIAIFTLGFNIMIQNSEIVGKGIHKTVIQNILLLVVVLVLIPIALIGESPMTGLTGTIGGTTFSSYFEGETPSIYSSTVGASSSGGVVSQADKCAADAFVDIDYLLFTQGWVNASPGTIVDEATFNGMKNKFVGNESGAFDYLKGNINNRITAAKINTIKEDGTYSGGPLYKNTGSVLSGYILAYAEDDTPIITDECDEKFWKVFLEREWSYDATSMPRYKGTYYSPKILSTFDGQVPYNIHVDWLQLYLSLIVVGIFMFVTAYKVIKLIIQLFWNFIISAIIAPADITNGRRMREIIMGTVGIVISLWFTGVTYQVFDAARDFINTNSSWFNNNSIAKSLMLLFFSLALMEGPNLLQRILGVDAGLVRSGATLAGAAMVGKKLVSTPINAARSIAGVAGNVATAPYRAYRHHQNAQEARLSRNGIRRGANDVGKSAGQMLKENKDSMKAQREQRVDNALRGGITADSKANYEQRAEQRRNRVASEQMQKQMRNETDNNRAKANILQNNPQQAEQYVSAKDSSRIAEKEAGLASNQNSNRNVREASVDMKAGTLENNAKVKAMQNDHDMAQKYEGSRDDLRIAGKVASATSDKSNDRIAKETALDMNKEKQQNIAQAEALSNSSFAQEYAGAKANAELSGKEARIAYNNSSEGHKTLEDNASANMQLNVQENEAMIRAAQNNPELANAVASSNLIKDSYQAESKANAYQNNPEAVQRIVSSEKRVKDMTNANGTNLSESSLSNSPHSFHFDEKNMKVTLDGKTYNAEFVKSVPLNNIMGKKNKESTKLGGK